MPSPPHEEPEEEPGTGKRSGLINLADTSPPDYKLLWEESRFQKSVQDLENFKTLMIQAHVSTLELADFYQESTGSADNDGAASYPLEDLLSSLEEAAGAVEARVETGRILHLE